ncbi:MAG: SUMF1/EgtB/PvdO family nonheme iron enzyme [Bacteroidia bacterium]|nr:SUMF1/EgtB/PvdO family nonheme iron enzyme [Bacteroidia bacterium]
MRKVVVNTFSISHQITLGEYKLYLNEIKRDFSFAYYKSQWPDSTMAAKETLEKYMTVVLYEKYPVVGISWFKVMNYCRWRTLKETSDSIRFVYRLPFYSEWVIAQNYLSSQKIKNDFNGNNSDWLISAYDESFYDLVADSKTSAYDYFYLPKAKDSKVLTRMRYMGDSFLQQNVTFTSKTYYYASEGVLDVSFRLVKELYDKTNKKSMAESMLTYYRILK